MTNADRKAVIIGAGLGGLALALRLAARGYRVTVCERGASIGGKMNHWSSNGFTFDTGPSLITMPWVFRETFAACGERMEDHIELVSMRPIMEAVYPDGTRFLYSNNMPDWLETVRNLDARDVDGFFRLMQLGARIYELSKETFLRRPPSAPPDARVFRALRHFPLRHAWGNYACAVAAHVRSPYLRQLYNRYPTYVGSSPYASPATLLVIPYIEYAFGGWYVKGGLYKIVEALQRIAAKNGVEVLTQTGVTRIETEAGRASAVETEDGRRIAADIVVMNGDHAATHRLLGSAPSNDATEARSMSGVVNLLGVRKQLPKLYHHTVYFSSDYPAEFDQIFRLRQFPEEPTVYVSAPSRGDRSLVPDDGEALFLMANAPATGDHSWQPQEPVVRERMFSVLRRGGFPVLPSDIAVDQLWTPETIAQRYDMPGGAIYGTHSHGWRSAFLRPANRDAKVRGLYYVGGSTHPGGGTPTVLISARITGELIQREEPA